MKIIIKIENNENENKNHFPSLLGGLLSLAEK